jgi:Histidine kinase-, DNA gyrase B-, and HSP90-like ATPase
MEEDREDIDFRIGNRAILRYKSLDYKIWYALAEFVDNSSQSYFNHKDELDEIYRETNDRFTVHIVTNRGDSLEISDNAYGMTRSQLKKALTIGAEPEDTSGRNEFGMGLKTAACWLGDVWTIKTKAVGSLEELEVRFDVNGIAMGTETLNIVVRIRPESERKLGFTNLLIEKLHNPIATKTKTKIIDFLQSIYRVDLRTGQMDLQYDHVPMVYEGESNLRQAHDGTIYKQEIKPFIVDGKEVTGWLGILKEDRGIAGVNKGGLAIIRRGRCILAQPEAWKPKGLFGEGDGQNSLVSQRLVGEIHLDDFKVSHTKNAIRFYGDEEEQIEKELENQFKEYKAVASIPYKHLQNNPIITQVQKEEAKRLLSSPAITNFVVFEPVPSDKVVSDNMQATLADIMLFDPEITIRYNDQMNVEIYTDVVKSENDAYVLVEYPNESKIVVVVNNKHPFYQKSISDDPVVNNWISAAADALAEWKCRREGGDIKPDTIRLLKDNILRRITLPE